MNIIYLLRYVTGVRTAVFVTVYAQISFLVGILQVYKIQISLRK